MASDALTIKEMFLALADLPSNDRAARLAEVDAATRQRVVALLRSHDEAGSESPAPDGPRTDAFVATGLESSDSEQIGQHVGPYKLLEKLGEGGMGTVWAAEQLEPIKRRVALKLIKAGMDSTKVLRRFEAERQALAMMDHANIAKVLDAGQIPPVAPGGLAGRPFFVMELIHGINITKYCDQEHLTPRERLELFIPVCQAVQHAHQKGIIHRDLKPSNVLVGLYDGRPVPKVIDFGVAKATQQALTEGTIHTEVGQIVGTLEYMSPEQAELNNLDIDTRSDIYSLGVILYELLAGTPPFTRKQLQSAAFSEMLRVIREVEPQKPSTRLSSSDELPSIAANRHLDPKRLTKTISGDLDWIVMKCLEKERGRRYETANALATDIQRHLADEPVLAGPPSPTYRLRKFVRRNRGAVIAAGLVAASLVGGVGVASWQWRRAVASESDAIKDRDLARTSARAEKLARVESDAVVDFFDRKVLAAVRPESRADGLGREVTLRRAIEAALPSLDAQFREQPLVEARLRMTLASSFWYLGDAKLAGEHYELARKLFSKHSGADHINTLQCAIGVANCHSAMGRHPEALKMREKTFAIFRDKFGLDNEDTLMAMNNLANSYQSTGQYESARALNQDVLSRRKIVIGPDHVETLMSMNNLATNIHHLGRQEEALRLREELLAKRRTVLGVDHLDTMQSMHNLASSYGALGRTQEAWPLAEEAFKRRRDRLGLDHPHTLESMLNLAACLGDLGRYPEALSIEKELLAIRRTKHGPDHPDTLQTMNNLAFTHAAMNNHDEALKLRIETLKLRRAKHGPTHPSTFYSMNYLASSYAELGRHNEAMSLREETLRLRRIHLPPDHIDTLQSLHNVALSHAALGRYDEALKTHLECLAIRKTKLGTTHRHVMQSLYSIACVHSLMISAASDPVKQSEIAMKSLQQAIAAGFKDISRLKLDKDLAPLRDLDEFKALIAALEAKTPAAKP